MVRLLFSLIAIAAAVNAQDGRYVGCGLLVGKEGSKHCSQTTYICTESSVALPFFFPESREKRLQHWRLRLPALTSSLARFEKNLRSPCNALKSCSECLDPSLSEICGWCSPDPAQWANGSSLFQCMDHTSVGWGCSHLYSVGNCSAGYVCDQNTSQCVLTDPGEGDTLANCAVEKRGKREKSRVYFLRKRSFLSCLVPTTSLTFPTNSTPLPT